MTQPTYAAPSSQGPKPKRKSGSRLTFGHLMMIVSGLLAFLLTIGVLNARSATITVFIAKDNIVAGEVINLSKFEPKELPSSSLNEEFASKEMIESGNNFSSRSIMQGEPLTKGGLTPDTDKNNVRLQSIPVSRSLAVNGDIARGDRIDIIATPGEGICAFRVLNNIEVVAVPGSGGGGGVLSSSGRDFSITVSIEKAGDDLVLAHWINEGTFQVIKSTSAGNTGLTIEDPLCGNAPTASDLSQGSGGVQ